MPDQRAERSTVKTAFPIVALVLGLTFTLLLLTGVGLHIWSSYEHLQSAQDRDVRLQELTGTITYLDEVLTMSARMAAATGDIRWEQRYRSFEPQLDAVIQEAKRLSPDAYAGSAAVQTDAANLALVDMEHRSFELNASGDHQAAAALLASPAYDEQKALYAEGNQQTIAASKDNSVDALHSAQVQWIVALLAVAAPILVAVWITVVVATSRHAAARRRAEEALHEQARRDPLTGVLNHTAIIDELQELATNGGGGSRCAVAMVDVDGLKATNDTFGHQVGDEALITIANTCLAAGGIVGRYGGDEFVVLLPGRDRAGAQQYCDSVTERLANAKQLDPISGQAVPLAATIGVACYPQEGRLPAELIKLADDAMYAQRRDRQDARPAPRLLREAS